jgi:hypothetical protein
MSMETREIDREIIALAPDSRPDVSIDERRRRDLIKRVRKLRGWAWTTRRTHSFKLTVASGAKTRSGPCQPTPTSRHKPSNRDFLIRLIEINE